LVIDWSKSEGGDIMFTILFFGGVIGIGLIFWARKDRGGYCVPSDKRTKHHKKIRALGVSRHVDHALPSSSPQRGNVQMPPEFMVNSWLAVPFLKEYPCNDMYRICNKI